MPNDDHYQPARHRPVQVHDDAGGAAPVSGRAGRVPLQVPQCPRARHRTWRRTCDEIREEIRPLVQPAVPGRRTGLPAFDAFHQERLRRFPRPVPAQREVHQRHRRCRRARSTSRIRGPWLHTILFEIPVLAIVNEVYFRNTAQAARSGGRARARLDAKIAQLHGRRPGRAARSPTTARAGASAKAWHEEVLRTPGRAALGAGPGRPVRRHQQRAVRDEAGPDAAGHHGARVPAGLPGAGAAAARQPDLRLRDPGPRSTAATWASRCRDVYGMDAFLRDFDMYFCKLFDGARHDSGDPFQWGERMLAHYAQEPRRSAHQDADLQRQPDGSAHDRAVPAVPAAAASWRSASAPT